MTLKTTTSYDMMESSRTTLEWLGATARAFGSYPVMSAFPIPAIRLMAAWGEVTERAFSRMIVKPDWGIGTVVGEDGRDLVIEVTPVVRRPFGDLIQFKVHDRAPMKRRVMLIAPMSGHYATLMRSTVTSLLPDCDVFVTDWHNARDIPVSKGKFDIEDFTEYLVCFMRHMGPDTHVIAVCQPAPLALAATAYLAEEDPGAQPRTLTLIGGPIDPAAAATEVTDFGNSITMGQLEHLSIQRVGFNYRGVGRLVYPGLAQLSSFIAMNRETHTKAFIDQILSVAKGTAGDHDRHNRFYDEYLAVMDMTAEFYLSTVERVFKTREIATNTFAVAGRPVDIGRITDVAVMVVEGEKDDISAPGQCLAALPLLTGLPEDKKAHHLEPGAGHYGIFAGSSWRNNIRPLVLRFLDANSSAARPAAVGEEPAEAPVPAAPTEAPRRARIKVVSGAERLPEPQTDEVPGGQTERPTPGQSSSVPV